MKSLMKNFGAKLEDMDLIESAHIHERLPQDLQPVMKHRRNAFHRVLIDQGIHQSYQIQTVLKYFAFFKIRKIKIIFGRVSWVRGVGGGLKLMKINSLHFWTNWTIDLFTFFYLNGIEDFFWKISWRFLLKKLWLLTSKRWTMSSALRTLTPVLSFASERSLPTKRRDPGSTTDGEKRGKLKYRSCTCVTPSGFPVLKRLKTHWSIPNLHLSKKTLAT